MKFKIPRPVLSKELLLIIKREIKRQKIPIDRISKKNLKILAEISKEIEHTGCPKRFVCKKLPHQLGKGIFLAPTAEPILKGEVIASYGGEISVVIHNEGEGEEAGAYAFAPIESFLLNREEQIFFDKAHHYHPKRLYSLKLDACKKGNFTRFVNHSSKPNVVADTFFIPKNPYGLTPSPLEIVYVAKKKILPGEQLLISYEEGDETYWKPFHITPFPMTPQTFVLNSTLQLFSQP